MGVKVGGTAGGGHDDVGFQIQRGFHIYRGPAADFCQFTGGKFFLDGCIVGISGKVYANQAVHQAKLVQVRQVGGGHRDEAVDGHFDGDGVVKPFRGRCAALHQDVGGRIFGAQPRGGNGDHFVVVEVFNGEPVGVGNGRFLRKIVYRFVVGFHAAIGEIGGRGFGHRFFGGNGRRLYRSFFRRLIRFGFRCFVVCSLIGRTVAGDQPEHNQKNS